MADAGGPPDLDVAALLAQVRGQSDSEQRQEQLDAALEAMEATHRRASIAIRQFERTGRTGAEAAAIAALSTLALEETNAAAAAVPTSALGPGEQRAAGAATVAARTAGSDEPTAMLAQPPPAERRPASGARPSDARPNARSEPSGPGGGWPRASAEVPSPSGAEVTQTYVALHARQTPGPAGHGGSAASLEPARRSPAATTERPSVAAGQAQAATGPTQGDSRAAPAAGSQAPPPVADPALLPSRVFAGRGADFGRTEPTRTKIIKRKK